MNDKGIICGKCNGKGCQVCGGKGRLFAMITEYEKMKLAEIINKGLKGKVKMNIQLTRAVY